MQINLKKTNKELGTIMSKSQLRNKWMKKLYKRGGEKGRNPHCLDEVPKNRPSRYITEHCSADVRWLQESTSYGGHSIPKGGHRRVSGIVRANVKEETRKQIDIALNEDK